VRTNGDGGVKSLGVLAVLSMAMYAAACAMSSDEELPEVLSPLPWDTCPAVRVGRAITEGATYFGDEGGLTDCADAEFNACRTGRVGYRLRIGQSGELMTLEFEEPHFPAVEACVASRLRAAVFAPAVDCTLSPVESVFRGGVSWQPGVGLSEAVPGMAGIIPALPECYVSSLLAAQQPDAADGASRRPRR
jgi:hypothetical protein